jgi:cytochrome c oxidase subunit IV
MTDGSSNRSIDHRQLWRGPAAVWLILIVLFGVNLAVAYIPLGAANTAVNLLIGAVMVTILATFLMDLRRANALLWLAASAGLLWIVIMFALTFSDYLSRRS